MVKLGFKIVDQFNQKPFIKLLKCRWPSLFALKVGAKQKRQRSFEAIQI